MRIQGVVKLQELNGRQAVVLQRDGERFQIELDGAPDVVRYALKPENLVLLRPSSPAGGGTGHASPLKANATPNPAAAAAWEERSPSFYCDGYATQFSRQAGVSSTYHGTGVPPVKMTPSRPSAEDTLNFSQYFSRPAVALEVHDKNKKNSEGAIYIPSPTSTGLLVPTDQLTTSPHNGDRGLTSSIKVSFNREPDTSISTPNWSEQDPSTVKKGDRRLPSSIKVSLKNPDSDISTLNGKMSSSSFVPEAASSPFDLDQSTVSLHKRISVVLLSVSPWAPQRLDTNTHTYTHDLS